MCACGDVKGETKIRVGKAPSFVLNLLTLLVEGAKYKGPSGL